MTLKKQQRAEHNSWKGARDRCTNPKSRVWGLYGGRGITMCSRWLHSFDAFFADMGPRPSPYHSLDRINVNGNYEASNCRWADRITQARNRQDGVGQQRANCIKLMIRQGFGTQAICRALDVSRDAVIRIRRGTVKGGWSQVEGSGGAA